MGRRHEDEGRVRAGRGKLPRKQPLFVDGNGKKAHPGGLQRLLEVQVDGVLDDDGFPTAPEDDRAERQRLGGSDRDDDLLRAAFDVAGPPEVVRDGGPKKRISGRIAVPERARRFVPEDRPERGRQFAERKAGKVRNAGAEVDQVGRVGRRLRERRLPGSGRTVSRAGACPEARAVRDVRPRSGARFEIALGQQLAVRVEDHVARDAELFRKPPGGWDLLPGPEAPLGDAPPELAVELPRQAFVFRAAGRAAAGAVQRDLEHRHSPCGWFHRKQLKWFLL